jgi:hypothetical protein
LILYLYGSPSIGAYFPGAVEFSGRLVAGANAMRSSAYSPYRRAVAVRRATKLNVAKKSLTPVERRDVERGLDAVLDLLPASVAVDPRNIDWEDRWYEIINDVIAMHRRREDSALRLMTAPGPRRFCTRLEQDRENTPLCCYSLDFAVFRLAYLARSSSGFSNVRFSLRGRPSSSSGYTRGGRRWSGSIVV